MNLARIIYFLFERSLNLVVLGAALWVGAVVIARRHQDPVISERTIVISEAEYRRFLAK